RGVLDCPVKPGNDTVRVNQESPSSLTQLIDLHPRGALELPLRQLGRQLRIVAALARLAEQVNADHDPAPGGDVAALAHALDKQRADRAFALGERYRLAVLRRIDVETRGHDGAERIGFLALLAIGFGDVVAVLWP